MEKAPLGTTAEYNRPSGTVRTEVGRQIESGSVGKHEWGFGKRGMGMTQEGLGALPGLEIRAGRAVLRCWNKASRLMRRKTSTDIVNLNSVGHYPNTALFNPKKKIRSREVA